MKLRAAALLLLVLACGKEGAPPATGVHPGPAKPIIIPPPPDDIERSSLLNFGRGAVVVSRTGEALLESSALGAIDGDPTTFWMTPPLDVQQSVVVALPAKSRIEQIGIRCGDKASPAHRVAFEASADGKTFVPLGTLVFHGKSDVEWLSVKPVDAAVIRASILDAPTGLVRIYSLLARGPELEPPHPPRISGNWTVNGRPATFVQDGSRVTGAMQYARNILHCDGGSNGRIIRLEWVRGPEFGLAVITADGEHLSGIQWHEEAVPLFFGDAWFGTHGTTPVFMPGDDNVARWFLQNKGRHSLYALVFRDDGSLDVPASAAGLQQLARLLAGTKGRLVAHEFREPNAQANRARAQRELDAIRRQLTPDELARVTFVAAGSDDPRQIPGSEAARELYSTVDLEVGR